MLLTEKLFLSKTDRAAANLKAGLEFLQANKKKPGITALPSGLQYEIIKQGQGTKPWPTQPVTCHYQGALINGSVFDSTLRRRKPATFRLNTVIKGWTEGLQLMTEGSKWRLYIPPHLGYGETYVPGINPNSTLIFEVELISVD